MKISEIFPSKYITAADLNGKSFTLTMSGVTLEEMMTHDNKRVPKPVCWFSNAQKGFVMNVTNARIIAALYGDDTAGWIGRRITLYPTQVRAFGQMQDALRVREEIPAQPKPASVAGSPLGQVEEPSGLDDDEDIADFDEGSLPIADAGIWDTPAAAASKAPDAISPAQLMRLTVLMGDYYGKDYGQYEAQCARDASKGAVSRLSELKVKEAQALIAKLEQAIKSRQANGKVAA